jgi:hypothetical protein
MVDKKKTSVGWLNIGLCYAPENADFTFWVSVFRPACPGPGRRPASNTATTHEWMISEQHERDPFCSGSQSLQTRKVKSGQIVGLLNPYTTCSARL